MIMIHHFIPSDLATVTVMSECQSCERRTLPFSRMRAPVRLAGTVGMGPRPEMFLMPVTAWSTMSRLLMRPSSPTWRPWRRSWPSTGRGWVSDWPPLTTRFVPSKVSRSARASSLLARPLLTLSISRIRRRYSSIW